jgi:hypothetical protein
MSAELQARDVRDSRICLPSSCGYAVGHFERGIMTLNELIDKLQLIQLHNGHVPVYVDSAFSAPRIEVVRNEYGNPVRIEIK